MKCRPLATLNTTAHVSFELSSLSHGASRDSLLFFSYLQHEWDDGPDSEEEPHAKAGGNVYFACLNIFEIDV